MPISPSVRGKGGFYEYFHIAVHCLARGHNPIAKTAPAQKAQVQQPANNNGGDTVKLTESQQVYQLYNQGRTISQIASSLSLAVSAVDNYLNISNSQ